MRTLALVTVLAASQVALAGNPPPELIAQVAITTGAGLKPVRDLVDAVKPGASAMITDQTLAMMFENMLHARGFAGVDVTGYAYLLVDNTGGLALLARVTDDKAVAKISGDAQVKQKDHWAVIGPRKVLDEVSGYALDTLAKQPTPKAIGAQVFTQALLAKYGPYVEMMKQVMASQNNGQIDPSFINAELDGLVGMMRDTAVMNVGLDETQTAATLDVALVPSANSRLAKFVATQKPSSFGLLDKLPSVTAQALVAGHLETGPYHDALIDMMMKIYASGAGNELTKLVEQIMNKATGELAMTFDMTPGAGIAMTQLFAVSDAKAVEASVAQIVALFAKPKTFQVMGYGTTMTATPGLPAHDGVTVRGYDLTYDFSKLPAAQQQQMKALMPSTVHTRVAVFDGLGAFVIAPKADAEVAQAIDAERGKVGHFVSSGPVAELLNAAKARHDSMALVVDVGRLSAAFTHAALPPGASTPGLVAIGAADKSLHLRFATTFATLKALAHP